MVTPSAVLVLLALAGSVWGGFGPETEVPPNPYFVTATQHQLGLATLGVIASKHYIVFCLYGLVLPGMEFTFGPLDNPVVLDLLEPTITTLCGVRKSCRTPSGYKALPFKLTDAADFTKNNSAELYYFKHSTKKFYTRSLMMIQDDLCVEEGQTDTDGNPLAGCGQFDTSNTVCLHQYDVYNGQTYASIGVVMINGVPVGPVAGTICDSSSDTTQVGPFVVLKMQGFRDSLLVEGDFEDA